MLTNLRRVMQTDKINREKPMQGSVKYTSQYQRYNRTRELVYNSSVQTFTNSKTLSYDSEWSNRRLELKRSFGSVYDKMEWYFNLRQEQQTSLNYKYIHGSEKCSDEPPFLVILCLSQPEHSIERDTIRNTWGSVSHTNVWSRNEKVSDNIKLMFVIGQASSTRIQQSINIEDEMHQDIIQSDFVDNYNHLTLKVLLGLQ